MYFKRNIFNYVLKVKTNMETNLVQKLNMKQLLIFTKLVYRSYKTSV